jgi:hypothetical protein
VSSSLRTLRSWRLGVLGVSFLCAGCPAKPKPIAQVQPDAAPTPAPTLRYEACTRGGGPIKPLRWGSLQLVPRGEVLQPEGQPPAPVRLVLGVLGDTKEALPATLERIGRLAEGLKRAGATAVLVLGGLDEKFEGQRAVLEKLRGLPVIGLPGDRESRSGWQAAMESTQPLGADLSRARGVALPGASLLGVPGYYLPHHLLAKEQGCSYSAEDLQALARVARDLPQPRLLLSHGPPRGEGKAAVDRAFGEANIGDPLLGNLLREAEIRFGLFAHVHESAGHATRRDGKPVPEGEWSDELLLAVGSADSVPHEDLTGRWSGGTAALLEIAGTRARFKLLRLDEAGSVR